MPDCVHSTGNASGWAKARYGQDACVVCGRCPWLNGYWVRTAVVFFGTHRVADYICEKCDPEGWAEFQARQVEVMLGE